METNLTRGNVTGVLVRFALPLFAANLLQSLYSLVDMAVMGRFLGSLDQGCLKPDDYFD